jgi:small subunit ribosomal protein S9
MIPGVSLTAPTDVPVEQARPVRVAKPADRYGWWWGTGRRKSAVARVRLKPGSPASMVVHTKTGLTKTIEEYFSEDRDRAEAYAALKATGTTDRFTIIAKMHGGGYMGQAAALKLAIARALVDYDPSFYDALRGAGMLTRDPREVERKKYGQAGARRRFQFSKR